MGGQRFFASDTFDRQVEDGEWMIPTDALTHSSPLAILAGDHLVADQTEARQTGVVHRAQITLSCVERHAITFDQTIDWFGWRCLAEEKRVYRRSETNGNARAVTNFDVLPSESAKDDDDDKTNVPRK